MQPIRNNTANRYSVNEQPTTERVSLQPPTPVGVAPAAAFDRAYTESLILKDPESLSFREAQQTKGNVLDQSISLLYQEMEAGRLIDAGELTDIRDLPAKEQAERVLGMMNRMETSTVTPRVAALMTVVGDYPHLTNEEFTNFYRKIPAEEMQQYLQIFRQQRQADLMGDYKEFFENVEPTNRFETVGGFVAGEIIPFMSVLTRWGLTREMFKAVVPDEKQGFIKGLFTGEARQAIREALVGASRDERDRMVRELVSILDEYEGDSETASWLTRYNVREHFEQILTQGVQQGTSDKHTADRIVGNLEVALGTFFTGLLARSAGKSIKSMGRVGAELTAIGAAEAVGNNTFKGSWLDLLANSDVGKKFNINKEDAVITSMVKPEAFVKDRKILTPDQKITLDRGERVMSRINEYSQSTQGLGLNKTDKYNAASRIIKELDEQQNMEIMPGMSTIDWLADDTGLSVRAVMGQTPTKGWDNLDDLTKEILEIDPDLNKFTVMRRNAEGNLEEAFASRKDFLEAALRGDQGGPYNYAGVRLTDLSDEAFIKASADQDPEILTKFFEKDARRRAGLADEYFLEFKQDHYWHTIDKEVFDNLGMQNTHWLVPRSQFFLPPNRMFSKEVYDANLLTLFRKESTARDLEELAAPFFKLGNNDAKETWRIFEWGEEYAKAEGKAPDAEKIMSEFPEITPKQMNALIGLRQTHDKMWSLLNTKLYREYSTLGYKSAIPKDPKLPTFHGKVLERKEILKEGVEGYDPVLDAMRPLTKDEIDILYDNGGSVIKNDLPIEAPKGGKADLIILGDGYDITKLDGAVLEYHPGYSIRLYEDPYYIVKRVANSTLNGKPAKKLHTEAYRTAPSKLSAENFLARGAKNRYDPDLDIYVNVEDPNITWKVQRAKELDQTESTLMQKQTIQQEGRLFWDKRHFNKIRDVYGNEAKLNDPIKSLEAAINMVARQVTTEDVVKRLKEGWTNQYKGLMKELGLSVDLKTQPLKNVVKALKGQLSNVSGQGRKRLKDAIDLAQYIRAQAGMEQVAVPKMRELVASLAYTVEGRGFTKIAHSMEKYAENFDPTRNIRSVAFKLFMVFRPARQVLLQSAQVGFIAPLDPLYVASGKMFADSFGLRLGWHGLRNTASDGYSVGAKAKMMGLSTKEYRKLVKEFDRSGLMESVDVHSFAGGVKKFDKRALPTTTVGAITDPVKKLGSKISSVSQDLGFNLGERNNLTFTYLIALRRMKKKKGVKSVLEFSREDWDDVTVEASNLALGMVRPNNLGYQTGLAGVATQFLSFTHKAGLTLLFQNPALTKMEAARIWAGTYLIYGANMFGSRDFVADHLRMMDAEGLLNASIPGTEATVLDFLAGGLIETGFNAIGQATNEAWQDLSVESITPGVNVKMIYEMQMRTLMNQPWRAVLGPFGSAANRFMLGFDAAGWIRGGDSPEMSPTDKAMLQLKAITTGTFPAYNDIVMGAIAEKTGRWYATDGRPLPIRSAMNSVIARQLFGVRTIEETQYYDFIGKVRDSEEAYQNFIQETKRNIRKMLLLKETGDITTKELREHFHMLHNVFEIIPEGRRHAAIEAVMNQELEPGQPSNTELLIDLSIKGSVDPRMQAMFEGFLETSGEDPETIKKVIDYSREIWERKTSNEQILHERVEERNK